MIALALSLLAAQLPQPVSPAPVAPQSAGKELFARAHCNRCHGEDGKGDTERGVELKAPDFTNKSFQKHATDKEMIDIISNGALDKTKKVLMQPYKDKLSKEQIRMLVRYVRSFRDG